MRDKFARAILVVAVMAWAMMFLAAGVLSFMPYSTARSLADQISLHGEANRFTPFLFNKIKTQTFWLISLLSILGGLFFLYRKKIGYWLTENLPSRNSLKNLTRWPALSRSEIVLLLFLMGVGLTLRLIQMQGIMEYDESMTYLLYAQNPWIAVSAYNEPNNHVFHTFLVSIVTMIFGGSIWSIRSIAFLSGILLIPIVFLLIRTTGTGQTPFQGWLPAVVIALNPLLCEYSANGRGYTLQILLVLLSWRVFVEIYRGNSDLLIILSLLCSLALWTLPTSIFPFLGLCLAFGGGVIQKRIKVGELSAFILLTGSITGFLWGPVVMASGIRAIVANPYANPQAVGLPVDPFFLRFGPMKEVLSLSLIGPVGFFIMLILLLFGMVAASPAWRWILAGQIVSILGLTALFKVTPPIRIWLFLIPLVAMTVDFGLGKFMKAVKASSRTVAIVLASLVVIYTILIIPQASDYGLGDDRIVTFSQIVANHWSLGQGIEIQADKTRLIKEAPEQFSKLYGYYNAHNVRYYLKRAGIPDSAFRWKKRKQLDSVWLILVQADGHPPDLSGGVYETMPWDVVLGPYSLAKQVPKGTIKKKGSVS